MADNFVVHDENPFEDRLIEFATCLVARLRIQLFRSCEELEALVDEVRPGGEVVVDVVQLGSEGQTRSLDLAQFGMDLGLGDLAVRYKPPAVWINDEEMEGLAFEFKDTGAPTGYLRALEHIDGHELQRDKPWLFKIDVNWRMPVWPQWVLGAQLADNRLVLKLQTQRNFMTEATITWGGTAEEMPADGEAFKSFGPDTTLDADALNARVIGGVQR